MNATTDDDVGQDDDFDIPASCIVLWWEGCQASDSEHDWHGTLIPAIVGTTGIRDHDALGASARCRRRSEKTTVNKTDCNSIAVSMAIPEVASTGLSRDRRAHGGFQFTSSEYVTCRSQIEIALEFRQLNSKDLYGTDSRS